MSIKKPGEGFRGVDGPIGYLLRQARHAVRLKIDRSLRKFGITHPQFSVLSVLEFEPGLHSAGIAHVCMISPQAVNMIVANLEERGLIRRVAHEVHGRVLEIFLTEEGKKKLVQCRKIVAAIETQMLAGLKPSEEKLIRKWLVSCAIESDKKVV